ncbi:unnamed protein product [Paramecium pentaurelia]|uniref:Uncharacterized protein n=1 Tax=Paramecium pentaurelia TaxID=43138 RepID=A0A8S1XWC4_9CILI|nr:unnamed protein product [Paramecium pentaurelia]
MHQYNGSSNQNQNLCFSSDLQSTIQADESIFYHGLAFQFRKIKEGAAFQNFINSQVQKSSGINQIIAIQKFVFFVQEEYLLLFFLISNFFNGGHQFTKIIKETQKLKIGQLILRKEICRVSLLNQNEKNNTNNQTKQNNFSYSSYHLNHNESNQVLFQQNP